jgi:hypothetical protein
MKFLNEIDGANRVKQDSNNRFLTAAEKDKLSGIEAGAQVNTVTSVAGKTGAVTVSKGDVGLGDVDNLSAASIRSGTTKAHVGLSNVDNVKQMPIAGGTFTGIATAHSNTSYTVRQMRNIILSTGDAVLSSMQDGDIWIKYK